MKRFLVFFVSFLIGISNVHAQENWEYLGGANLADVRKMIKEGTRYYALTENGVYYMEEDSLKWNIIEGTILPARLQPWYFIHDFYVANGVVYLIMGLDFPGLYIWKVEINENYKLTGVSFNRFKEFKSQGDTIQLTVDDKHIYTFDNLKTSNEYKVHSDVLPNNDINILDLGYAVSAHKLYNLKIVNDTISLDTILLDLPLEYDFVQLLHADSLVFVWMKKDLQSVLLKIDPISKQIEESLRFGHDSQRSYSLGKIHSGNYFKYENKTLSLVGNKLSSAKNVYSTKDLGETWDTISLFENNYREVFDSTFFVNNRYQILFSKDLGQSFEDRTYGILSIWWPKLRNEKIGWVLNTNSFGNIHFYLHNPDSLRFYEVPELKNYNWVLTDDNEYFGLKDRKFCRYNRSAEEWTCDFLINTSDEINRIITTNNILFVVANNVLKYSIDKGRSWSDIATGSIANSIVYHNGEYFVVLDGKVIKSKDLKEWSFVDIEPIIPESPNLRFLSYPFGLYLSPIIEKNIYKFNEDKNLFKGVEVNVGFGFHYEAINSHTFIGAIGSNPQLIRYTNDGGQTWQVVTNDFGNITTFDLKVANNEIYVLNMLGLWRRPLDFIPSSVKSEASELTSAITLSPNPTLNIFNIHLPPLSELKSVNIFDAQGRVVFTQDNGNTHIDMSPYSQGIYVVVLETNTGRVLKKMVKVE